MKRTAAGLVAVGVLALTACGTRLPDRSFGGRLVSGAVASESAAAAAATDPGAVPAQATDPGAGQQVTVDPSTGQQVTVDPGTGQQVVVQPGSNASNPTAATSTKKGATPTKGGAVSAKPTGAAAASKGALTASDRGVTPTSILLGNIVSAGGIFGAEQFAVSRYGVLAYFRDLNTKGGINGRKVIVNAYNDQGDGGENVKQVNQAVDTDKVFALVGNNIFAYDGADKVQSSATPDIGGQPIKAVYYKYSHLFNVLGTNVPRDNKQTGYNGSNYGSSESGQFFKQKVGSTKVGIVYYDQSDSQRGATVFGKGFEEASLPVKYYPVNLGLPNFANTVAQMQSDGIDTIADAMDANGNAKLCQAMEGNNAFINNVKAKISTVSTWSQRIPTEFKQTPKCRNLIYVLGSSRSYADKSDPGIAAFRAAMVKYFPSRESLMAQWTYEGWLAAQIFTEAATSCGANLTRTCVEAYLTKPGRYFNPDNNIADPQGASWFAKAEGEVAGQSNTACVSVGHWSDSLGTFETVSDIHKDCYTTKYYKYEIT